MRRLGCLAAVTRGMASARHAAATPGGTAPAARSGAVVPLSRAQVVAKWKGTTDSGGPVAARVISKAMAFVSGPSSQRRAAAAPGGAKEVGSIADISWDICERLDHAFTYYCPRGWVLDEKVRENFLSIELSPARPSPPAGEDGTASLSASSSSGSSSPPSAGRTASEEAVRQQQQAPIHGLTITSYAYFKKVQDPDCDKLLDAFLRRFNQCMDNSLEVLNRSTPRKRPAVDAQGRPVALTPEEAAKAAPSGEAVPIDAAHRSKLCDLIATRIGGAACEILFTPVLNGDMTSLEASRSETGITRARGLCRAFFHTNRQHHYVVVMAVPEDEFEASWDLVAHAVLGVRELSMGRDGN